MTELGDRLKEYRKAKKIPVEIKEEEEIKKVPAESITGKDNNNIYILKAIRNINSGNYKFFSRQAYYNYETGRSEPPIEILHTLARLYDTVPSNFFCEFGYLSIYAVELSLPFENKKDFQFGDYPSVSFSNSNNDSFSSLYFIENETPRYVFFSHQIMSSVINGLIFKKLAPRLNPVIENFRAKSIKVSPYSEEQLLQQILTILNINPDAFNEALNQVNWIEEDYGRIIIGIDELKNLIFDDDNPDNPPKVFRFDPPQPIKTAKLLWVLYKNNIQLQDWPDTSTDAAIYNEYHDRFDINVPEKRIPEVEMYLLEIMGYDYNQVKHLLVSILEANSNNPNFLKNTEENISYLIYQLLFYIAEEFPSYRYFQDSFNYVYGNKCFFATHDTEKQFFDGGEDMVDNILGSFDFPIGFFDSLRKRKKTSPADQGASSETKYQSPFSVILKTARQAMFPDLSAKSFSDVCGINYQAYNKYETGTNRPNNETLLQLAGILRLSIDELIGFFPKEQVSTLLTPLLYPNEIISAIDENSFTISTAKTSFNLPISEFAKHYIIARYECHDAIIKALKEEFLEHNNSLDVNDYELTASTNVDLAERIFNLPLDN